MEPNIFSVHLMERRFFFREQGWAETENLENEFEGFISCIQGSGKKDGPDVQAEVMDTCTEKQTG